MSHIPAELWQRYVEDEIGPEERERCEAHLSVCDQCLELYMQCIGQAEDRLPPLEDEAAFAAAAMNAFDKDAEEKRYAALSVLPAGKSDSRLPLLQHPFFHYAVAAAITLILMGSGVFHTITRQIAYIEPDPAKTSAAADASFSQKLLDQTIGMLDSIQPKRERGNNP